ncbi:MAG: rhodanese-like domain-containing protein [Geothrix sp.]|nr:rhodanese-like domain-containing protein [Geothrix sp.]
MEYWIYLIPIGAIAWVFWSKRSASEADIKALLGRNAQVVDVRTRGEFRTHHHPKSQNIPMDELEKAVGKLDKGRPVLLCCDTGSRSGFAVSYFKKHGFPEVLNLGSYRRLHTLLP